MAVTAEGQSVGYLSGGCRGFASAGAQSAANIAKLPELLGHQTKVPRPLSPSSADLTENVLGVPASLIEERPNLNCEIIERKRFNDQVHSGIKSPVMDHGIPRVAGGKQHLQ